MQRAIRIAMAAIIIASFAGKAIATIQNAGLSLADITLIPRNIAS